MINDQQKVSGNHFISMEKFENFVIGHENMERKKLEN